MGKEILKYDKNNNLIYRKGSSGFESWHEYDKNDNCIHYKNNNDNEYWYKYNKNEERIEITEQEFKYIKLRKKELEFNSRKYCSRFELLDI